MNEYEDISPISFILSLILTNEIRIGIAIEAYMFISTMLKKYDTSEKWIAASSHIYGLAEQYSMGKQHLPYLDLRTRTGAKKEMKKWSDVVYELTNETPHKFKLQHHSTFMHVPF